MATASQYGRNTMESDAGGGGGGDEMNRCRKRVEVISAHAPARHVYRSSLKTSNIPFTSAPSWWRSCSCVSGHFRQRYFTDSHSSFAAYGLILLENLVT